MIIKVERDGDTVTIFPEGRLDSMTAGEFERSVCENIDGAKTLVFDFLKLEYVSSAGLRVILNAMKSMDKRGGLIVKNVNEFISELFEMTGFSEILTIE